MLVPDMPGYQRISVDPIVTGYDYTSNHEHYMMTTQQYIDVKLQMYKHKYNRRYELG